ncbi:hypothetical protein EW026_g5848 [Hermanssonia centrifuga]|uniref:Fumarylacetoacetase-like C-terminal domain-containing protein n=1 Tax=Hermanssonia centrifuga TaxID=98765 RepID=A0A4S4KH85_9APHY|nr:hypothetical protein EW026_g5848 [Hermanssonia centrifuga]
MPAIKTNWSRLIRFVAAETAQIHIGEPIDPELDVGLAFHKEQAIKAYEIFGSALDPAAQVTKNVLTVKQLLPPLSREQIGVVRCLGLNYADHAAEANMAKPQFPILFYKPPTALIGPEAPITIPRVTQPASKHLPDYEVELTIVIGKAAKDVSEADALNYVLAYTGANDIFSVRQTIAFLSQGTTLLPGSVIMTGTPKGVGFVKKPPLYLKNGDDVTVWVDGGIGTLVNPVVEEGASAAVKAKL